MSSFYVSVKDHTIFIAYKLPEHYPLRIAPFYPWFSSSFAVRARCDVWRTPKSGSSR